MQPCQVSCISHESHTFSVSHASSSTCFISRILYFCLLHIVCTTATTNCFHQSQRQSFKCTKIPWRPGLHPGPRLNSLITAFSRPRDLKTNRKKEATKKKKREEERKKRGRDKKGRDGNR